MGSDPESPSLPECHAGRRGPVKTGDWGSAPAAVPVDCAGMAPHGALWRRDEARPGVDQVGATEDRLPRFAGGRHEPPEGNQRGQQELCPWLRPSIQSRHQRAQASGQEEPNQQAALQPGDSTGVFGLMHRATASSGDSYVREAAVIRERLEVQEAPRPTEPARDS